MKVSFGCLLIFFAVLLLGGNTFFSNRDLSILAAIAMFFGSFILVWELRAEVESRVHPNIAGGLYDEKHDKRRLEHWLFSSVTGLLLGIGVFTFSITLENPERMLGADFFGASVLAVLVKVNLQSVINTLRS